MSGRLCFFLCALGRNNHLDEKPGPVPASPAVPSRLFGFEKIYRLVLLVACLSILAYSGNVVSARAAQSQTVIPSWRELASPHHLWPADGAFYYSLSTGNGTKVHLVVIDTKSDNWLIKPGFGAKSTTTLQAAESGGASAAINGGYFNLSDGMSTSYVVIDGQLVADPLKNKALMDNPKLKPFVSNILNRSELRCLVDSKHEKIWQIARHNDPIPAGFSLLHSLQAGPRLLPELTSKEEAFVRTDSDGKEVDGISSEKAAARTAIGLTADGYMMLICAAAAKQDPESHGLTLAELAALLKDLGCCEAINFDGGSSTTMFIRRADRASQGAKELPSGQVVCGRTPLTLVRSTLLLERKTH